MTKRTGPVWYHNFGIHMVEFEQVDLRGLVGGDVKLLKDCQSALAASRSLIMTGTALNSSGAKLAMSSVDHTY